MDISAASISAMKQGETRAAVNLSMLKKTQDFVATQVMDLLQAIPQSPNFGAVGGNIDVRG
ncbi:MAG: YjfB family protein [Chitinivibrionia bacterium]|nr:YjfB family protein [Chitinivibrionia bacterium]